MRCVVYSRCELPYFRGIRGPIMSPTELDNQLILKWLYVGIDVREVMEDGSHRKLKSNDEKLLELINAKFEEKRLKQLAADAKLVIKEQPKEIKPLPKKEVPKVKPYEKIPKEEIKVEENKEEIKVDELPIELLIDNLEKPE